MKLLAVLSAALLLFSPSAHAYPATCPQFPDGTCSGPTLTPWTGPLSFRTNGQVIENVEIRTPTALYVPASNVTFRNVRFVYTGALDATFTVINNAGANNTFDRIEIDGQSNVARGISGTGTNSTVRNANIHHVGNGVEISAPFLVEDSYIHDIYSPPGTDWHADGIQIAGGNRVGVTIRHNTVILTGPQVGAISVVGTATAPATDVLVENNLLAGGGYTMYTQWGSNFRVINNRFSTQVFPKVGAYGIWYPGQQGIERSGNTILETGAPADS